MLSHPYVGVIDTPDKAFWYVRHHERRCRQVESLIVLRPDLAFYYFEEFVKCRWPEAEPALKSSPYYFERYLDLLIEHF